MTWNVRMSLSKTSKMRCRMTTKIRPSKNSKMKSRRRNLKIELQKNNRNRANMRYKISVKSQRVATHSRSNLAVLLRVQHPKKRALTKIHMHMLQGQLDQAPSRKAKTEKTQEKVL